MHAEYIYAFSESPVNMQHAMTRLPESHFFTFLLCFFLASCPVYVCIYMPGVLMFRSRIPDLALRGQEHGQATLLYFGMLISEL